jgi:Protein of unknown function (DUF3667)
MSGDLEAAGALATAGLAVGAIEGRETTQAGEGGCLNCGAALAGAYCSACGQAAHPHRTLLHMLEEVLHGLIHFDAKVWRTLPLLAVRPGTLTRNYTFGKRARYFSPLALFLFTIFLMFFVFAFVDVDFFRVTSASEDRAEITATLGEAQRELNRTEAELAAERAARGDREPTARERLSDEARERAIALARGVVADQRERLASRAPPPEVASGAPEPAQTKAAAPSGEGRWQDSVSEAAKSGEINVNTGFPALDARIVHSLENPDLALYKIQQAAYKFSFLLAPISLLFLWLLFIWKRGITLYDHAVFVLYSLSFAALVFILLALVNKVAWLEWVGAAVLFAGLPAHMFFHLKGAYALSWWSAIWRTPLLMLSAALSLIVFVLLIVLLGLAG